MKRKLFSLLASVLPLALLWAQPGEGYYDDAEGKSGEALRTALYGIIHNHTNVGYDGLWDVYEDSDVKPDGTIWDMYSDIPGGTPPYVFYPGEGKCGNYKNEGDCYNREHSLPKSWFGDASPMVSDAFHIYPTDGKVNGMRSNYPFGEVTSATFTSKNGSKLGRCDASLGYSGTVFEPIDEYKGDFARTYFYMSTCYKNVNFDQNSSGAAVFSGSQLKQWAVDMFLEWHRADPVSQKEIDRNNAVERWQHNRNPFIDYPELAEHIWGNLQDVPFTADGTVTPPEPDDFRALPATDVSETGFTANWTASTGATGYLLDVYTVQTTGEGVSEVLLESDFTGGLPDGWTADGFAQKQGGEESFRLASGSSDGEVSTTISLGGRAATLTVTAKQYNKDNSTLTLVVNGEESEAWTMTTSYADYTAELPAGASSIALSAQAGHRVYLASVRVETAGSRQEKVSADGYPMPVGDVLSHDVTGLAAGRTYYYVVTPQGNGAAPSDEVAVYTATTSAPSVSADAPAWYVAQGELHVAGLQGEPVQVFTLTGVPLYAVPAASGEVQIALPAPGMYLLRVGTWAGVVADR